MDQDNSNNAEEAALLAEQLMHLGRMEQLLRQTAEFEAENVPIDQEAAAMRRAVEESIRAIRTNEAVLLRLRTSGYEEHSANSRALNLSARISMSIEREFDRGRPDFSIRHFMSSTNESLGNPGLAASEQFPRENRQESSNQASGPGNGVSSRVLAELPVEPNVPQDEHRSDDEQSFGRS